MFRTKFGFYLKQNVLDAYCSEKDILIIEIEAYKQRKFAINKYYSSDVSQ